MLGAFHILLLKILTATQEDEYTIRQKSGKFSNFPLGRTAKKKKEAEI